MKFFQGLVAMVATVGLAGSVQAAPLASLSIVEFGFSMNHTTKLQGGSDDSETLANSELINMDILAGDGQQGGPNFDPVTNAADRTAGVVGFLFGYNGPTVGYIDPANGADVSGDVVGGHLTSLDLSAFTAGWNGSTFAVGGSTGAGTMTITPQGANDLIVWITTIPGGPPFGGNVANWSMIVSPTAVPEPMSMALIGSSLIGLVGLRRKFNA